LQSEVFVPIKEVTTNLYEISLGVVNAHLIDQPDALILIDTGSPGDDAKIAAALAELGRSPADLTHIIVTHCHADHAGSLAALQRHSNAVTIMHGEDAALVKQGRSLRTLTPAPGLLPKLLFRLFIASTPATIEPVRVDRTVADGELLPLAGGLRVIHAPGHSAGQIALLWKERGVLFAADAVANMPRLGYSLGYEDFVLGRETAARLGSFDFATACFGHGKPVIGNANERFRRKFGEKGDLA
jgi:glyoxylase-like metal-dependent hydrolase (beta-lactamase superfamily II)